MAAAETNTSGSIGTPVFILGIMPRCGTNFLANLLFLHPDCEPPNPVWEDFLISHLDQLRAYSKAVAARWDEDWGVDSQSRALLEHALGSGIRRFLQDLAPGKRAVSKTPSVNNLHLFFRFFPAARLVLLVRDGRSIVESGAQTFGWSADAASRSVNEAAQTIRDFEQNFAHQKAQYRVVRYEDLWKNTESEIRQLLAFLQLDPDLYDFSQAENLPVRGSSELSGQHGKSVHWDPVEQTGSFDPLSRFSHWTRSQHFHYNHIAGASMQHFGYQPADVQDSLGFLTLVSRIRAIAWRIKRIVKPAGR